jgi:hypothetical protein
MSGELETEDSLTTQGFIPQLLHAMNLLAVHNQKLEC